MKTVEFSGIIKFEYGEFTKIILLQEDGLKLDLINRIDEAVNSFGNNTVQVNYWISDKKKTKNKMMEDLVKKLCGSINAEYETETCSGSSWTGSWTNKNSKLNIGGHDLLSELSSYQEKYIILELNFSEVKK